MGHGSADKLSEARERAETARRLDQRIEEARRQVAEYRAKVDELAAQLKKETSDVRRLERLSLSRIAAEVLGNLPERRAKEESERLAAEAKFEAARQSLLSAEAALENLQKRRAELGDVEAAYQAALNERAAELESMGGEIGQRLRELEEARGRLRARVKELDEALETGRVAAESLNQVEAELASASNWGTWDMLGGGFIATMAKRQHMDRAQELVEQAQQALASFNRELGDVSQSIRETLDLGAFMGFADFFFDNIFVDMAVQNRIHQALERVRQHLSTVQEVMDRVEKEKVETQDRLAKLDAERARLVQQAG